MKDGLHEMPYQISSYFRSTAHRFCFLAALGGVVIALPTAALSQDDVPHCRDILSVPPLDTILSQEEGPGFGSISTDRLGAALLGAECDEETLVAFFAAWGWELIGVYHRQSEGGPSDARYRSDINIGFCRPRPIPWRWVFRRCKATAGILMFENRITRVHAGLHI